MEAAITTKQDVLKIIYQNRARLIHDYLGVDYDIVWDVVQNKIPILH